MYFESDKFTESEISLNIYFGTSLFFADKFEKELQNDVHSVEIGKPPTPETDVEEMGVDGNGSRPRIPEVVGGRSELLTQASKYVEMKYSRERGRYLVVSSAL